MKRKLIASVVFLCACVALATHYVIGTVGTGDYSFQAVGGANVFLPTSVAPDTAFRMTWVVTSTNAVTVPGKSGLTYNSVINWGDGSGDKTVTAYNDADLTHSYNPTGTFNIVISGTFPSIYFNNGGSKTCVKNVSNLGDVGWTTFDSAFEGCTSLTNVGGYAKTDSVTSFLQAFSGCSKLKSLDAATWVMTSVTTLQDAFYSCVLLELLDTRLWSLVNCTTCYRGFANLYEVKNYLISTLPAKLTSGYQMYYGADECAGDVSAIVNLASNNTLISFYDCDAMTYSTSNGCFSSNIKHLFDFNWQAATLSAVEGDRLLVDFNTSGATGGVFNISGVANQKVTNVGTNAKNALVAKGWTVTLP